MSHEYLALVERIKDPRRAQILSQGREEILKIQEREREGLDPWGEEDELLLGDYHAFSSDLYVVLPRDSENVRDYAEKKFANRNGQVLAIEIGGPGRRLFQGFPRGLFAETAGVALSDRRIAGQRAEDAANNHHLLVGDAFSPGGEGKQSIKEWLQGRKVGLIIERLGAGRNLLLGDPYSLAETVAEWYEMLGEGGAILAELPEKLVPLLKPLQKLIKKEAKDTIEITYARKPKRKDQSFIFLPSSGSIADTDTQEKWFLRLEKKPGAPEKLSMLSPLAVKHAYDLIRFIDTIYSTRAAIPFSFELYNNGYPYTYRESVDPFLHQILSDEAVSVSYPAGERFQKETLVAVSNHETNTDFILELAQTANSHSMISGQPGIVTIRWWDRSEGNAGILRVSTDPTVSLEAEQTIFGRQFPKNKREQSKFNTLWNSGRGISVDSFRRLGLNESALEQLLLRLDRAMPNGELTQKIQRYLEQKKGAKVAA